MVAIVVSLRSSWRVRLDLGLTTAPRGPRSGGFSSFVGAVSLAVNLYLRATRYRHAASPYGVHVSRPDVRLVQFAPLGPFRRCRSAESDPAL